MSTYQRWCHCGRGGMRVLSYLSHSEGVSCSTSSHMWGCWHFPRFPKGPTWFPVYSSGQSAWGHLNQYITQLFWHMLSLSLDAMSIVQMVLLPFKCTCITKLTGLLKSFTKSSCVRYYHWDFLLDLVVLVLCGQLLTACRLFVLCLVEFDL